MKTIKSMLLALLCLFLLATTAHATETDALPTDAGYIRVETGEAHVLALKADGTVWTWGSNMFGALGDGTERSRYVPKQVAGLTDAIDIAAGRGFSVALKSDGTVWGWGSNIVGQLGFDDPDVNYVYQATKLNGLSDIVSIHVDDITLYALDREGVLHTYGRKAEEPGLPAHKADPTGRFVRYVSCGGSSLGIDENGAVWHGEVELPEYQGARDVAILNSGAWGKESCFIVLKTGEIVAIGCNNYGQMGTGFTTTTYVPQKIEGLTDVKTVTANDNIYVLHRDGTVRVLYHERQDLRFQKLSLTGIDEIVQTDQDTIVLKNDGTVVSWPTGYLRDDTGEPDYRDKEKLSNIVHLNASKDVFFALDQDGTVFLNEEALDIRDLKQAYQANRGQEHSLYLTIDGKLLSEFKYWDEQDNKQSRALHEVNVGGAVKQFAVSPSTMTVIYVLREDGVLCLLRSSLGVEYYEAWDDLPRLSEICANFYSLLALDENGNVWQLGADGGNLGRDDTADFDGSHTVPGLHNIKTIAAGAAYCFAITESGDLYAWGENRNNALFPGKQYTDSDSWQPIKTHLISLTIGKAEMEVNNAPLAIPAAPVLVEGRTLVPIREVAENLGATVRWEAPGTITVQTDEDVLVLQIGSLQVQHNGRTETIDVAPVLLEGKTFLPLRYVCEQLGAELLWEETAQRITIVK